MKFFTYLIGAIPIIAYGAIFGYVLVDWASNSQTPAAWYVMGLGFLGIIRFLAIDRAFNTLFSDPEIFDILKKRYLPKE